MYVIIYMWDFLICFNMYCGYILIVYCTVYTTHTYTVYEAQYSMYMYIEHCWVCLLYNVNGIMQSVYYIEHMYYLLIL